MCCHQENLVLQRRAPRNRRSHWCWRMCSPNSQMGWPCRKKARNWLLEHPRWWIHSNPQIPRKRWMCPRTQTNCWCWKQSPRSSLQEGRLRQSCCCWWCQTKPLRWGPKHSPRCCSPQRIHSLSYWKLLLSRTMSMISTLLYQLIILLNYLLNNSW